MSARYNKNVLLIRSMLASGQTSTRELSAGSKFNSVLVRILKSVQNDNFRSTHRWLEKRFKSEKQNRHYTNVTTIFRQQAPFLRSISVLTRKESCSKSKSSSFRVVWVKIWQKTESNSKSFVLAYFLQKGRLGDGAKEKVSPTTIKPTQFMLRFI